MYERDTIFEQYMREVERYPLITVEREKELSDIIHGNSSKEEKTKAKNELIVSNLRIVVKVALDVDSKTHGFKDKNVSVMDLIQAGNLGLIHAAGMFLSERNVKFVSYAYITVQRRMMDCVKDSRFIKMPKNYYKHIHDMDNIQDAGELNDEKLAKKMNIEEETLERVKLNRHGKTSVEDLGDLLERFETDEIPLAEKMNHNQLRGYVFEKIKELKPHYREALLYKFFSHQEMTLGMIGAKMNVTREGVRQILAHAIHSLKAKINEDDAWEKLGSKKRDSSSKFSEEELEKLGIKIKEKNNEEK